AYPLRCAIPAARKPRVAILATRSTRCVSPLAGALRVVLRSTKRAPARLCAYPSLDGTLRVDLRSTKRAPARLSDTSFVSAGCAPRAKKRVFCQLRSSGKCKWLGELRRDRLDQRRARSGECRTNGLGERV